MSVLGGWFLVELLTLDFSAGIVHPYYSSALGLGNGGDGRRRAPSRWGRSRGRGRAQPVLRGYVLAVLAIAGTAAAQLGADRPRRRSAVVAHTAGPFVARRPGCDLGGPPARRLGDRRRRRRVARRADRVLLQCSAGAGRWHIPNRRAVQRRGFGRTRRHAPPIREPMRGWSASSRTTARQRGPTPRSPSPPARRRR